jgi:hypothetical protein
MSRSEELLRFIITKKIPLREAIEVLQLVEKLVKDKQAAKEKAVIEDYETRGG